MRRLAARNLKELMRDPLSLGINIALPAALLLALGALGNAIGEADAPFLTASNLTPGVVLFGFVMLMFMSALLLSRDRDSSLLARFLTAPLTPGDFVIAYSLPYLGVAFLQAVVVFCIAAVMGLEMTGSVLLVVLLVFVVAVFYVALGMAMGSVFATAPLSGAYTVVLLLTIFGGAWMDIEEIGGFFKSMADVLPFAHAMDAMRDVMIQGAGFGDIAIDVWWVLGFTIAAVVLAVLVFRSRMTE